ncbi:conserved hypothetical protein [Ricinus communis]|uniref:Uncharacterized protein n=1 Tax=Ricinus communis TaxID=3988 RepID=B9RZ13_RICCO|nr:conserved hypothetical protein [Ricinus communis]
MGHIGKKRSTCPLAELGQLAVPGLSQYAQAQGEISVQVCSWLPSKSSGFHVHICYM